MMHKSITRIQSHIVVNILQTMDMLKLTADKPYWHFNNTYPVIFTFHEYILTFISGGGEDGISVTAR